MSASSVIVPVRGEHCDSDVVRFACEMLNTQRGGSLHILYVIEVERGLPVDAEIALATAKAEEVLNSLEDVAKSYKCSTEAELVQARQAGTAVVQEAVSKGVDTIVLGLPYKERYGTFSLGETVPYVLKNAPCRVIVWRDEVATTGTNGRIQ